MREYIVLRDLQAPKTSEPFGEVFRFRGGGLQVEAVAPPEPRIDVETLDAKGLHEVARDQDVVAIAPKMPIKLIEPMAATGEAATGNAWGISAVGAVESAFTGAGVVVAILDTGIDRDHPAFAGVTLIEKDFTGSGNGDTQGHGSHCAGSIFGRDVDSARIGVAPGVTRAFIGKVLPDKAGGNSEMIIRAINWATDNGADVISMSLGFDFPGMVTSLVNNGFPVDLATSQALEAYRGNLRMFDALMNLVRKRSVFSSGPVIVAAAGNESRRAVNPEYEIAATLPSAAEGVLSVGALGRDGQFYSVAPFSNTLPQLSAPGVDIKSVKAGGGTCGLSGTSMACPHVAGVAALWWESVRAAAVPASAQMVESKLLASARTDVFAAGVDVADRGAGLVTAP